MTGFYRAFRFGISWLLGLFFRIEPPVDPHRGLSLEGPVIYVGNHPNGLVDPGLVFVLAQRQITFLAKAPLFPIPVLGSILRGMGALPVYRKQDDPTQMAKNDGTLAASVKALTSNGALAIFPEGKSHSEPQLQELKTGCARIALEATKQGHPVRIVPIGLTYWEKNRFRSKVRVELGPAIDVAAFAPKEGEDAFEAAKRLTHAIAEALRALTLQLEQWDDLPLIKTAEALYALKTGQEANDGERLRHFAKGMQLLREEQPERFEALKQQVHAYQHRLELVRTRADRIPVEYRGDTVAWFVVRNLLVLIGAPLFFAGMLLFVIPYWIPIAVVAFAKPKDDVEATIKVLTLLVLAPLWTAVLAVLAWTLLGTGLGILALVAALPLALFTRYYLERRVRAWRDARTFFVLLSRQRLHAQLVTQGEQIAAELEAVTKELRPRVEGPPSPPAGEGGREAAG